MTAFAASFSGSSEMKRTSRCSPSSAWMRLISLGVRKLETTMACSICWRSSCRRMRHFELGLAETCVLQRVARGFRRILAFDLERGQLLHFLVKRLVADAIAELVDMGVQERIRDHRFEHLVLHAGFQLRRDLGAAELAGERDLLALPGVLRLLHARSSRRWPWPRSSRARGSGRRCRRHPTRQKRG